MFTDSRVHGAPRVETEPHRRGARRLHAEHANPRIRLLDRDGHAGDQPAAADGNDDDVELGDLLEELEAGRAGARADHSRRRTDART